ncbi:MAG: pyridoxal-phosphate dependent enzyme [Bacteroidetes bacterium]|nr:pyridoxal-phosphate dependent enzyme [Bacteroidota bacterium]
MLNTGAITTDSLSLLLLDEKKCSADVLRLDKIHPIISGNKWFKLKYYFKKASEEKKQIIITYGGSYSNHIIATACAASEAGLNSIGIIRGERAAVLSPTLLAAEKYGMQLQFISRDEYKRKEDILFRKEIEEKYADALIIPEGGFGYEGIKGAEEILLLVDKAKYTHILCAVGTGTMYAGLVNVSGPTQTVVGICVLKGIENLSIQLDAWAIHNEKKSAHQILHDYHFGGYAKKNDQLIEFINTFYRQTRIPTDFVYTGKLFYAVTELLKNNFFPAGSKLLIIHSGGLQGNNSLTKDTLIF